MKTLFTFGLTLLTIVVFGQDCDCKSQLTYVINYYENNNPAYQKIKNDAKESQKYQSDKAKRLKKPNLKKTMMPVSFTWMPMFPC